MKYYYAVVSPSNYLSVCAGAHGYVQPALFERESAAIDFQKHMHLDQCDYRVVKVQLELTGEETHVFKFPVGDGSPLPEVSNVREDGHSTTLGSN